MITQHEKADGTSPPEIFTNPGISSSIGEVRLVDIQHISIGKRIREDIGDLSDLAKSISARGLLHPVVLDHDMTLVAGFRRIAAFKQLGNTSIPAYVVNTLKDATDILQAERDENVCRKEMVCSEKWEMAEKLRPFFEKLAADAKLAGQKAGGKTSGRGRKKELLPANFAESNLPSDKRARKLVADAVQTSHATLSKIGAVVEAAREDPGRFGELREMMDATGKVSAAYGKLKHHQSSEEVKRSAELPTGKYHVIYADPPWSYGDSGEPQNGTLVSYGRAETHYPAMSIQQLCDMKVVDHVEDDAALFMWVTSPLLAECWPIIKAWGFNYKASFVWDKVKHNFGHYNSVRHEFLLICTRGKGMPRAGNLFDSVQSIERSDKHSQKPAEFRKIIETMYPIGRKLELFCRDKADGWDVWGDQS